MTDEVEIPEYVGGRPRTKRVELQSPVKYKGKLYEALVVRRLSTAQVSAWADAAKSGKPDADLGQIVDEDGEAVPQVVLDFLDDDDDLEVMKVADDFLPRRLSDALKSGSETQT